MATKSTEELLEQILAAQLAQLMLLQSIQANVAQHSALPGGMRPAHPQWGKAVELLEAAAKHLNPDTGGTMDEWLKSKP